MAQSAFSRPRSKPASGRCSVHKIPLVHDRVRLIEIWMVGDTAPVTMEADFNRCPSCSPKVETFAIQSARDFARKIATSSRHAPPKVERIAIVWEDGRREEHKG